MTIPRWSTDQGCGWLVLAALLGLLGLARPTYAAEFTCAAGDMACLIGAIHAANAKGTANTLTLATGLYTLTAVNNDTDGANGLPSVTSTLTIQGSGADRTIIERAANAPVFRLGHVASTGHLTLAGLTLRGGLMWIGVGGLVNQGVLTLTRSLWADNGGGGLSNQGSLTLLNSTLARNYGAGPAGGSGGGLINHSVATIINTTFVGNSTTGRFGGAGGGFNNGGMLTLINSTLTDNGPTVGGDGGGLFNTGGGTAALLNSTLTRNHAGNGGGIEVFSGTVVLQNTLIALNVITEHSLGGPDCLGPGTSLGGNLIGDPTDCAITLQASDLIGAPGLGTFTDDGTPGQGYVPLLPESPAIDAGDPAACPATDQLGQLRVTPCDIGAIEFTPVTLTLGLNQVTFRAGETLRVALGIHHPGPSHTADAYLGVLLPDGVTVFFITSLAPLDGVVTRLDADPRTFAPLAACFDFTPGLEVTLADFFVYTFTGGESVGSYAIFTLLTPPGALADGQVETGDLLGLTLQPFTVRP